MFFPDDRCTASPPVPSSCAVVAARGQRQSAYSAAHHCGARTRTPEPSCIAWLSLGLLIATLSLFPHCA